MAGVAGQGGRAHSRKTLSSGERLWPRLSEARYTEIEAIRQFQIVQKSLERLEVRLVAERELSAEEERKFTEIILGRIGYRFQLTFSHHEEIPRGPGGKYEDFKYWRALFPLRLDRRF